MIKFFNKIIPEESPNLDYEDEIDIEAKKLISEIEQMNLNPIRAKNKNTYSVTNWNYEKTINIQESSFFTKYLLFVDLIFRVSNIYKYNYNTGFTQYLLTIYNLLTIKFSTSIDTKELVKIGATQSEYDIITLGIVGVWLINFILLVVLNNKYKLTKKIENNTLIHESERAGAVIFNY